MKSCGAGRSLKKEKNPKRAFKTVSPKFLKISEIVRNIGERTHNTLNT
jgi:hypothetical protein